MSLTADVWDALPGYVRDADERLGLPLRTWLSGLCDLVQPTVDALATVDLCDPAITPRGLLDWSAALGGVDLAGVPEADQRDYLAAESVRRRGTPEAIAARVALTLAGSRWVDVQIGYLGEMGLRVSTWTRETPDRAATVAAAAREAPAWLALTVTDLAGITYTMLATRYATYADMTATGLTYAQLAQASGADETPGWLFPAVDLWPADTLYPEGL